MGDYFVGLNPPRIDINRLCLCEGEARSNLNKPDGTPGGVPSSGLVFSFLAAVLIYIMCLLRGTEGYQALPR